MLSKNAKDFIKNRVSPNQNEYWLQRGYSLEDAKEKVSERQRTFSLKECIKKHGEEEGKKLWDERQKKWQKSLVENGNLKCGQSKVARDFFNAIIEVCDLNTANVKSFDYNKEYYINLTGGVFYAYDFTLTDKKKVIEYNGDLFHANPERFTADERPNPFKQHLTSADIWLNDQNKLNAIKEKGYDVLVIWDSEYQTQPEETIQKCIDFINS